MDEVLGTLDLLLDDREVAGGVGAVAVDGVLVDEDEGVGEDVEGDGQAAAGGAGFELFVFEGLVAVVEDGHLLSSMPGGSDPVRGRWRGAKVLERGVIVTWGAVSIRTRVRRGNCKRLPPPFEMRDGGGSSHDDFDLSIAISGRYIGRAFQPFSGGWVFVPTATP